ncbi:protein-export membrane protein SecF [Pilimelia anulata]|uniref:Protein-export membrane protein SecF n=1 Tax=Pilimelia anulata TaxID=53371 RepID=A0A8J3B9B6_9ACTN|nr:protein translocase subunit SecF [Pilimelia anulata]GGJ86311.1 protein-export membrane protein SecF [Pilimelia anulata]
MSGLATRLYKGEAGVNIVGRRNMWFGVAGGAILVAILSFVLSGFHLGIEFAGGNQFSVPATVGTQEQVEEAFRDAGATVGTSQKVGGNAYDIKTAALDPDDVDRVRQTVEAKFGLPANAISTAAVSAAWGAQITRSALIGLALFIAAVAVYLVIRFEWRMAAAAIASLVLDLILTAGVYSLTGFEVTPSTVIGFLTILGFALYDVVVVFDKIQENTRGITASGTQTYAEAANLAVNQTLMRSINTGLVALLPVGGLLFIGAGLMKAGTLKDLSLVLFVGMAFAVLSSIFFATPVLVALKSAEPRIKAHTQRVLGRRAAIARGEEVPGSRRRANRPAAAPAAPAAPAAEAPATGAGEGGSTGGGATRPSGGAPRPGSRPGSKGRRSGGGKRR